MPLRWSSRCWGGDRLPPRPAPRGGSLSCLSLSLVACGDYGPGARGPAALGGRGLGYQPTDEHRMRMSTFHSAQKGLRVIPCDWRVSAGGVRLAHQTARQSRAGAFVQAVMERYKGRQIRWSSLDLVFTQRAPSMTVSPLNHQVQMHMAPRLNLAIRGETHIRHQRSIERVERSLLEQLVHYLGARGKRVDAVATQGSLPTRGLSKALSPGTGSDLLLGWPVSTVVRRPVTESSPDNRGLLTATATIRPGPREAAHTGADQTPSPSARQGAIAKLIEHTARPVTLPGLELRLVSPQKQPSGTRRPAEVAQAERQTTATAPLQPAAPAAPSPPALDINAISEKVYHRLLRRQQLERERRGLY